MLKTVFTISVAIAAMCLFAEPAAAQYGGRPAIGRPGLGRSGNIRPRISPYLNLLNGNNPIGFNYYQRVRPEVEFLNANRRVNQSLDTLGQNVNDLQQRQKELKGGLTQTGHVPRFMDLRGYFPGLGRR